jgi:hypothetical protein
MFEDWTGLTSSAFAYDNYVDLQGLTVEEKAMAFF